MATATRSVDPGSRRAARRHRIAFSGRPAARCNRAAARNAGEAHGAPTGSAQATRCSDTAVAVNLGEAAVVVEGLVGRVLVGTDRGRDGSEVAGEVELAPGEGVVVELRS